MNTKKLKLVGPSLGGGRNRFWVIDPGAGTAQLGEEGIPLPSQSASWRISETLPEKGKFSVLPFAGGTAIARGEVQRGGIRLAVEEVFSGERFRRESSQAPSQEFFLLVGDKREISPEEARSLKETLPEVIFL